MGVLAVGDLVRVRSGGPCMVVRRVDRVGTVTSSYRSHGVVHLVSLPGACLVRLGRVVLRLRRKT